MKKTLFGIGLLTCLFALTPAYGQNEEAAIVLKDLDHPAGCVALSLTLLDPSGPPLETKEEIHTVANSKGNVKLICHFDLPEDFQLSRPYKDSGFPCGIYVSDNRSILTYNTTFLATPGGKAILICEDKVKRLR